MNRKKLKHKKTSRIRFRLSIEEKEIIKAYAKECHMTVSEYIRVVGTSFIPTTTVNPDYLSELNQITEDLNKLGNLLKLWLNDQLTITYYQKYGVKNLINKINEKHNEFEFALHTIENDKNVYQITDF